MQAYIYARFSTADQAKGSSLARQLADCRSLCDQNGWTRSADRELVDQGKSAFSGANRSGDSLLAEFERAVSCGSISKGAVLVVERLDRLSRQPVADVFQLVTRLTEAGVAVATVDGGRLYVQGSFDLTNIIELVVKAQLSHEESAKKSQRLAAAWSLKRQRAKTGDRRALTRRCPAWITVDDGSGEHILIEDRAMLIRRIFDLTIAGLGKQMIARVFNREKIPSWGGRSDVEQGWRASYIHKILGSRTVLGEFQPHRRIGGKRVPEGAPLSGLYPPVIDAVVFGRAQAARASRTGMAGRRGKMLSNLLSGLARCSACYGIMTYRDKGRVGEQYLVCDQGLRQHGCNSRVYFNYPALEAAMIENFLHLALFDTHFAPLPDAHVIELECIAQREVIRDLNDRQDRLIDLLSRMENIEVERKLVQLTVELASVKENLVALERGLNEVRGKAAPQVTVARVRELLQNLTSIDHDAKILARGTIQSALRDLIDQVLCDPEARQTIVYFGDRMVRFDRQGTVLETTQEPTSRLSLRLDELDKEGR